jgi:hypothetical protein
MVEQHLNNMQSKVLFKLGIIIQNAFSGYMTHSKLVTS